MYADYTAMPSQRISIKMNAWDYDYLCRVQETVLFVGSKFNDAPPLNEIVRGLIKYVSIKIRESNQAAFEFRKSMDLFSEIPHEVYERMKESAASVPSAEGGSYIFMASDEDVLTMDNIIKIVQPNDPSRETSYPSIIRNAIRHVLGKEGFFLRENKQKYDFIGLAILSALYGIALDLMVQLALDPFFNIRELSADSRNKVSRMSKEYQNLSRYISTHVRTDSTEGTVISIDLYRDPEKYYRDRKEFVSLIGDFNYVDLHAGLVIASYAWEFDIGSMPYILNTLVVVGPITRTDFESPEKGFDVKIHEKRGSLKNKSGETTDRLSLYRAFYGLSLRWIMTGLLPMMKQVSLRVS